MTDILLRGVRTHNLQNIDLNLQHNSLIVITGLSGSGKSSLAFDTLYAEGQRRYVESLSTYARQFLSVMAKPDLDMIAGLSPAIAIEQKATSHNPRSTVGTITEIYDYLRLLYARIGTPYCPKHHLPLYVQTISQVVDQVLAFPEQSKIMIVAPVVQGRKGEFTHLLMQLRRQGFVRAIIDGDMYELDDPPSLQLRKKHTIEVVVDRCKVRQEQKQRLAESIETAVDLTEGSVKVVLLDDQGKITKQDIFSTKFACPKCGYSVTELEPRCFSFNNPAGACSGCEGLGVEQDFDIAKVIIDEELSLAAGAVRGWDKRNHYYFQLLQSLAKHYDFSLEIAFKKLPKRIQSVILFGSGNELISMRYTTLSGKRVNKKRSFEGILPNMRRRYHETESTTVRDELAKYLTVTACSECQGDRINQASRNVFIQDVNLPDLCRLSIKDLYHFFEQCTLEGYQAAIADKILKEVQSRLGFLLDVGLEYLTLGRSASTLSGGEAQRIRLASQIGSGLVGVMYILDEPSIGLHQRDNERLLATLARLRDLGNTVIVVEHDEDSMRFADWVVDIGPGAGIHGGHIIAQGKVSDILDNEQSLTADYLSGRKKIAVPAARRSANPTKMLKINGASCHNLKKIDVKIPIGLLTCVTGVSGSGKSSLINHTLYPAAAKAFGLVCSKEIGEHTSMTGLDHLDKVIAIDQSPIGRTPRSNPATYSGVFTHIRDLFAMTPESRSRGYKAGRFSFNVRGGRCEACEGDGVMRVEMHFLPDVYVPCDVCAGKRYNRETLEVKYKGKNIHEILQLTVEEAAEVFKAIPALKRRLDTLIDVGLSYVSLGQSAPTLSGGEAQRLKLAKELSKRDTGSTLYLLDEPTTGLHFHDINQLLKVLVRLRDKGNSILIIEHNLDVIKTADWIIDLGPEGGDGGGELLCQGSPEHVAKCDTSYTGQYLKKML